MPKSYVVHTNNVDELNRVLNSIHADVGAAHGKITVIQQQQAASIVSLPLAPASASSPPVTGNATSLNGFVQAIPATPSTIVLRDSEGGITATSLNGAATSLNGFVQAIPATPSTIVLRDSGGGITATAGMFSGAGAAIAINGSAGSPSYLTIDQTINGGIKWRFGNTGAVSFTTFDILNITASKTLASWDQNGNLANLAGISATAGTFNVVTASVSISSPYHYGSSYPTGLTTGNVPFGFNSAGAQCLGMVGITAAAPYYASVNNTIQFLYINPSTGLPVSSYGTACTDTVIGMMLGPYTVYHSGNVNSTYSALLALIGIQGCPTAYPGSTKPGFTGILTGAIIWMVGDNSWNVSQGNGLLTGGTCYTATGVAGQQATGWSAAQAGSFYIGAIAASAVSAQAMATNISLVNQVIQTSIFSSGGAGYSGWGIPGNNTGLPVGWALYGNNSTVTSKDLNGNAIANCIGEFGGNFNFQGFNLNQLGVAKLFYGSSGTYIATTPGAWTWTAPKLGSSNPAYRVRITLQAGGCGGTGNTANNFATGGGAGGFISIILTLTGGNVLSGNVGAGGTGGTTIATVAGGSTTLNFATGTGSNLTGMSPGLFETASSGGTNGSGGGASGLYATFAGAGAAGSAAFYVWYVVPLAVAAAGGSQSTATPSGACGNWPGNDDAGAPSAFGPGGIGYGVAPLATSYGAGGAPTLSGNGAAGAGGCVIIEFL